MAEFLSDAWITDLDAAARQAAAPSGLRLVVQQVVLGERGADTRYVIRFDDGHVSVTAGQAEDADLTLTQDRATAAEIARGELSAQVAFMAGRLRVGGDLRDVVERSRDLAAMADVFEATRATTTW